MVILSIKFDKNLVLKEIQFCRGFTIIINSVNRKLSLKGVEVYSARGH